MNRARRDENKALESSKSVEGGRNRGKQGLYILREKKATGSNGGNMSIQGRGRK